MASLIGQKLKLKNKMLRVGSEAPNFRLTNTNLDTVTLDDFKGKKVKIITTFPSINTSVCDLQVKKLNDLYANNKDVVVLNVSMDLPFAFKNWCASNNAENIIGLSDWKTQEFAKDYGVFIFDFHLLYRSIFILNEDNIITYIQFAQAIDKSLDFDSIVKEVNLLLNL